MSFAHDIGVVAAASIVSIGVNWKSFEEQGKTLQKHQHIIQDQGNIIARQGERLTSLEGALARYNDRAQSARDLQTDDSPFQRDANNNWLTVDESALFIFTKGIVVGEFNDACTYGNAVLSVERKDQWNGIGNCPSGDGSVTFGGNNVASGVGSTVTGGIYNKVGVYGPYSTVTGGQKNQVDGGSSSISGGQGNYIYGIWSSVSGGKNNYIYSFAEYSSIVGGSNHKVYGPHSTVTGGFSHQVDGAYSSISGGANNHIFPDASYSSILGGSDHKIYAQLGTSALLSLNSTNSTNAQMIPNHHSEERIRSLEDHSPFNCTETLCTSEDKHFLFTEGVVIGKINPHCDYGRGTLSVDFGKRKKGTNCPQKSGSVTFGQSSTAKTMASFKYKREKE